MRSFKAKAVSVLDGSLPGLKLEQEALEIP